MTLIKRALLVCSVAFVCAAMMLAQAPANLRGQVSDPSGAAIPGATVTVTGPNNLVRTAETNSNGNYAINGLPPGTYVVRISATGFNLFENLEMTLESARATTVDAKLTLAVDKQEVTVTDEPTVTVEVDPNKNASATVLSGSDLDMLSDDPTDLANDLQALAGPSAGPNGGQIFVDGFSNGQLPPKNSIREIRVNSNPFAAEFDRVGFGRIEILTRPGTDRLRGSLLADFDAGKFDARNPYATADPSFLTRNFQANVGGSLNKKTSFFVDYSNRHQDDQSLIRATILDSNFLPTPFTQTVATPNSRQSFSPRLDYQINTNHTLQARYSLNKTDTPTSGVGGFNLASQATTTAALNHAFNITETWVMNTSTINESRFQYAHNNNTTSGVNTAPTVTIAGAFTGGAAGTGTAYTTQNSYEFQNYTTMTRGVHLVKVGLRVRGTLQEDSTDANFNGTFSFASLNAYAITQQGLAQNLTMAQIVAKGGGAFQYTRTAGTPLVQVSQVDIAPFVQDDWRVKPNITLSLGLRYETQNNISNWNNLAPRVGLAWGIGGGTGRTRTPKTVIRAGYGIFYDRFALNQVQQADRLNGVNQQRYVVQSPQFFLNNIPALTQLGSTQSSTVWRIDPGLVAPRIFQGSIGIERQLPKNITLSVNYNNSRGVHQLRARDVNAPLPGTYVAGVLNSGVYPLGTSNPVNQYESSGILKQSQLTVNVNARLSARYSMFGFYNYGHASNNTDGVNSFPASTYDLTPEWGRSGFDVRHRIFMGGNVTAPLGIRLAPMIIFSTAAPFNITLGQDQNGDTQNNDRPSFATALSNPANVVHTVYGDLNTKPVAGEVIIPRNFGQAYGSFNINVRASRTWGFGEKTGGAARAAAGGGGGRGGPGGFGGGPPGGGPPGGGPPGGGGGGPFGGGGGTNRKYQMTLSLEVRNLMNSVNPGSPVGTIGSSLFGQAQGVSGGFGPGGGGPGGGGGASQSANRRLEMQLRFNF